MMGEEEDLRDTTPFDISMDGIADMVDLMVVVAKSDGRIDAREADSLAVLINTLNRSVLDRRVTSTIVQESLMRLQRHGTRATLERVGQTLAYLGKLEDALGLAVDVATSGKALTELEWTSLVLAGRAGQLEPRTIRRIIGDCPSDAMM